MKSKNMTNRSNHDSLKELDDQYPHVAVNSDACTLAFRHIIITLRNISLLSEDSIRHVSTYEAKDTLGRRCRVIVNCGAEPPNIEIGVLGYDSLLAAASITHEKQDELNQSLLNLCYATLETA